MLRCWDTSYWGVGLQRVGGWDTNCLSVTIQTVGCHDTNGWCLRIQTVWVSGYNQLVSQDINCQGVWIQIVGLYGYLLLGCKKQTALNCVSEKGDWVSDPTNLGVRIETVWVSIRNSFNVAIKNLRVSGRKALGCWDTTYWAQDITSGFGHKLLRYRNTHCCDVKIQSVVC